MQKSEERVAIAPSESDLSLTTDEKQTTLSKQRQWPDVLRRQSFRGWRGGILIGLIITVTTLTINVIGISIMAGTRSRSSSDNGASILLDGNCDTVQKVDIALHLVINVLSTCLLSASNYAMQCLSAPNRREVDLSHAKRRWLDIGVLSLRNLRRINTDRVWLWILLGSSSLPLHFFYNSAIFTSTSVQDYTIYRAYDSSVNGSNTPFNIIFANVSIIIDRANLDQPQNLSNRDCIAAFARDLQQDYSTIVSVSTNASALNSVPDPGPVLYSNQNQIFSSDPYSWMCTSSNASSLCRDQRISPFGWAPFNIPVDYCLAMKVPQSCKVQGSIQMMAIVLSVNLVKAVLLLYLWQSKREDPLMTVGDAISSFIIRCDPSTKNYCWLDYKRLTQWSAYSRDTRILSHHIEHRIPLMHSDKGRFCARPDSNAQGGHLANRSYVWADSVSRTQWVVISVFGIGLLTHLILTFLSASGTKFPARAEYSRNGTLISTSVAGPMPKGFGFSTPENIIKTWRTSSEGFAGLLDNVLIANAPQLMLSLWYSALNSLLTCLYLNREWRSFAYQRKSLRVSTVPRGMQRSTYTLQLPYKIALPLLTTSAILHWLCSQSLYTVAFEFIDSTSAKDTSSIIYNSCAYSPIGFIVLVVIIVVMMTSILVSSKLRYDKLIPLCGTSSAVISAACHLAGDEDADEVVLQPLKWGQTSLIKDEDEQMIGHLAFSGKEIGKPDPSQLYR